VAKKGILHGHGPVLPLDNMELIPGVLVALMNITNQDTINNTIQIIGKDWLTHN
jgi:hypothetical protein